MRSVPSLSRKSLCKEQSSKDVCIERIKLSELALQRWKALGDAHRTYNDLQSPIATAIAKFVSAHSSDSEGRETACNGGEQKQEHHREDNPNKVKGNTISSTHASSVQANVETRGLLELLADFEDLFQKTLEEISSVCKLLEIDTVQEQTTTKGNSSSKLVKSLSRSLSLKILSSAWKSRSSKVRCLPSDEKDGQHSSTLKYLGVWEKQLYYQVEKVQNEEIIGGAREVNAAKQSAVLVLNQIRQLTDQELSPQLENLLGGLTTYWVKISDCYNTQAMIMSDMVVKSHYIPPHRMSCEAKQRPAAEELQAQLENWLEGSANLVSSQKAYIKALHDWARQPLPPCCEENNNNNNALSLLEKWSSCLDNLFADVTVIKAIGDLGSKVGELVELQRREHEHTSQVTQLKGEQWKIKTVKSGKAKDKYDRLTQRIEEQEVEYEASRKETEKNAVMLVRTGFTTLFQSLAEFSKNVAQKYGDVRVDRENN